MKDGIKNQICLHFAIFLKTGYYTLRKNKPIANKIQLIAGGNLVVVQLTTDQVLTMAPDASSASAGKKLNNTKHWKNTGQSPEALWGECQGSALYQVRVDLSSLTIQCSCPSRKQPCKHGLGLLLLTATTPAAVPTGEPPEWIVSWLTKRAAVSKRKETTKAKAGDSPSAAQIKTAEKRMVLVAQGIEHLDLWLNDLVRNGLGSVERQPFSFWENQAKQMVDAQAPGIAARIRRLATLPNASADWPERLLVQLGQLALLSQAFHRLDALDVALQEDVRQLIGWTLKEDEVALRGERVNDNWLTIGQIVENGDRTRMQRTWFLGEQTRRAALVLQFAMPGSAFEKSYPLGARQRADLVFWPGADPQRAFVARLHGDPLTFPAHLPGVETIDEFFAGVARAKARQPWQERFLCTIQRVIPIYTIANDTWCVRDRNGHALPLTRGEHWQLLAFSGGYSVDFGGEWDGEAITPLAVMAEDVYHKL